MKDAPLPARQLTGHIINERRWDDGGMGLNRGIQWRNHGKPHVGGGEPRTRSDTSARHDLPRHRFTDPDHPLESVRSQRKAEQPNRLPVDDGMAQEVCMADSFEGFNQIQHQ